MKTGYRVIRIKGKNGAVYLYEDRINTFLKEWLGAQKPSSNLLFDISSISTYGRSNPYAEYGYNRDREHLPQVNLALLSSCKTGLPLWYRELKGSMSDKAVLDNVLDELDKYDVGRFTFIGDRGFFHRETGVTPKEYRAGK